MKFDRNIIEKLIESNVESHALLHQQFLHLETQYAKLVAAYQDLQAQKNESNLVPLDTFNEVKSAYSEAAMLLSQAQQELNERDEIIKTLNAKLDNAYYDLRIAKENEVEPMWKETYDL